nr:MAG TPA: hypothetical protein [Caudoviricetes sp.]
MCYNVLIVRRGGRKSRLRKSAHKSGSFVFLRE